MRKFLVPLALAAAALSQASTFTLNSLELGGATGQLVLSGSIVTGTYSAGPFSAKLDSGPNFRVYCADLGHSAHYGVADPVTIQDTASLAAGYGHAAQIYNKYAPLAGNDTLKNAALQGAIWRAIYGSDLILADGAVGATALAEGYLIEDLSAYSKHASYYNVGGASQSMIGAQAVPEPASMAALALGGLGLLRRRKKA